MLSGAARSPCRHRSCPPVLLAGTLTLGLLSAACSSSHAATTRRTTTSAPPDSTTSAPPPTTTTTATITFPAVIGQAMAQFDPLPAGARAPVRLPAVNGFVSAQTGGLGGQDNVTLIVTPTQLPVNSPALSSGAGRELASFSTTPTASASNASGELARARSQSIAGCQGPSTAIVLAGGVAATTCPTIEGAAVNWTVGTWNVQVLTLDGTTPSTAEANHLAPVITAASLPQSDAGGVLSVVVPGSPSAGSADTAALEWTVGADVYQVRSSDDPDSALAVAGAMRPYPA